MASVDVAVIEHGEIEKNGGNICCHGKGPGYATPLEAMAGPREALLYVTCVYTGKTLEILIKFNLYRS